MAGNGVMDWWRNATDEQKAERRAQMAAERAEQEARREAQAAEWREQKNYAYSDEGLTRAVAGEEFPASVHPRQARVLLTLDTVARRERAYGEASTRQNLMGGILSDQLHYVAQDLNRMIAEGREDDEMYGQRVAREHREKDRAERDARTAAAVARLQA